VSNNTPVKKYLPIILFASLVPLLLFFDLLSKYLTDGKSLGVIPYIIRFDSHHNSGIAFSMFYGAGLWLLIVTSILCVGAVVAWWFMARKNLFASIAFALFVAGGIGNLYDRIAYGYVRDFIKFAFMPRFPIFNLADIFLTVGAVMLAVYFIFLASRKKTNEA